MAFVSAVHRSVWGMLIKYGAQCVGKVVGADIPDCCGEIGLGGIDISLPDIPSLRGLDSLEKDLKHKLEHSGACGGHMSHAMCLWAASSRHDEPCDASVVVTAKKAICYCCSKALNNPGMVMFWYACGDAARDAVQRLLQLLLQCRGLTRVHAPATLLVHAPAPTEDGRSDTLSLALCIGLAMLIDLKEFVPLTTKGCCGGDDDGST
jgi:hypothetical protein